MPDNTDSTISPEENLQNLVSREAINEQEAKGIALAELYLFRLDTETPVSTTLILDLHKTAFGHLYDWAGKWRRVNLIVGQLELPAPHQVVQLMYQFVDNLNFKMTLAKTREEHLNCLFFAHYEFIRIHPFTNGNGRTGRMLLNLVALKFGYKPLVLYHREGESRQIYIAAIREADKGNLTPLQNLISDELVRF